MENKKNVVVKIYGYSENGKKFGVLIPKSAEAGSFQDEVVRLARYIAQAAETGFMPEELKFPEAKEYTQDNEG